MKKTIKILIDKMDKLQEKQDGTLQGGFSSIKGGFNASLLKQNGNCTNTTSCTQTNVSSCTNSGFCFV